MSNILVSEYLPDEQLDLLRTHHAVVYDPDLCTDRSRLLPQLAGVEALFTRNRTRVDEELIAAAPDLRVVGRLGVGLDNIDMNGCEQAGVQVISAAGENAVSVAEYVIGAMLVVVRDVFSMTPSMIAGEWPRQGHAFGHELMGKTMGLVGFGSIARQVAKRAAGLEMEVIAHDPFVPDDDPAWGTVRSMRPGDTARLRRRDQCPCPVERRHPQPHRRTRLGAHEADGGPDQHIQGRHRRRDGSRARLCSTESSEAPLSMFSPRSRWDLSRPRVRHRPQPAPHAARSGQHPRIGRSGGQDDRREGDDGAGRLDEQTLLVLHPGEEVRFASVMRTMSSRRTPPPPRTLGTHTSGSTANTMLGSNS